MAQPSSDLSPANGVEIIERQSRAAQAALIELLEASSVYHEDINAGSSSVVFIGWNPWHWAELPDEVQPLIGAARHAHDTLRDFATLAFEAGAPDRVSEIDKLSAWLLRRIEQQNGSYPHGAPEQSIEAIIDSVEPRIDKFLAAVARLPTAHGAEEQLLVADTSSLLDRPDLQDWKLDGQRWTVVLVPQVLSELDDRKRDPRTADAANKVIRQLDAFARRGDTFSGVPLAGRLRLREIPISPDMNQTLPWLRADTPDDRIVAAAVALVHADLRSRIAVLASDRNIRNKARMAGLSTVSTREL